MTKPSNRKTSTITWLIVLVVIILISGWMYKHYSKPPQHSIKPAPTKVTIVKVSLQSWDKKISVLGNVFALKGAMLRAQASGNIIKVSAKPSQWVKKGQLIFTIDPQGLKAQLNYDRDQLKISLQEYKEISVLYKKNIASLRSFQMATAKYHSAQANLKRTTKQFNLTLTTAPFSGQLGVPLVRLGYFVNKGDKLIGLHNPNELAIDFQVPSKYIKDIYFGQTVHLLSTIHDKKLMKGKIYGINSHVNAKTRSITVRANIINPPKKFLAGMYMHTSVILDEKISAIVVPETAISYSTNGKFVYRVKNGVAIKQRVIAGLREGQHVQIVKGLKEGDQIVSEGLVKIRNGSKVVNSQ